MIAVWVRCLRKRLLWLWLLWKIELLFELTHRVLLREVNQRCLRDQKLERGPHRLKELLTVLLDICLKNDLFTLQIKQC